jgi:hypothetical protein
MRAVSAIADVGGIGFRDSEHRSPSGDRDPGKPGLNLPNIGIFIGPICFQRRTPSPFPGFVSPLSFGMLPSGFRISRCYSADLCKFD